MNVAIIGGGPGGLMTAWHINNKIGELCQLTIFEASHRLGGKLVSRHFPKTGVLYEAGVAELYDYSGTGPDPLRALIEETLGLTTVPMDSDAVVIDDTIVRDRDHLAGCLGKPTADAIQAFRDRCAELLTPAQYYESLGKDDNFHPWARKTAFEVLEDEVDDDLARKYIRIAAHSDLAAASHLTNGLTALKNYVMDLDGYMQLYSIVGGNEQLTEALASRVKAAIALNSPVQKVGRTGDGRYALTVNRDGSLTTEIFDAVVCALPLSWLSTVEWGSGDLEAAMFEHIAYFDRPGHYLRISIAFETPFWQDKIPDHWWMSDAFSGCCVYVENARHDSGRYGVLGWLIAGNDALAFSNLPDDVLIKRALDSLPSEFQPFRSQMIEGAVQRWLYTVNALPGGYPVRDVKTNHIPEPDEHPGLFVVGDYLYDATLNGVLDSSDATSDLLMSHLIKEHAARRRKPGPDGAPASPRITKAYFENYRGIGPYDEAWKTFFDPQYIADLSRMIWGKRIGTTTSGSPKALRILDAGSASGLTVQALRDIGIDATGIEINRSIHARTPDAMREHNLLGSVTSLPFPDNHFDVVYENCLYHVPEGRVDKAISELHRVTKHGIIFGSVTSEIALSLLNRYDLTRGARTLATLWEWSEMFFEYDFELALEDQEMLRAVWTRTLDAGFGADRWFEDAETLRYSAYTKIAP